MCIAIPGKILSKDKDLTAKVDFGGVTRIIHIDLTPQVEVGDYILVHAGFSINQLDPEEAQARLSLFEEIEKNL